MVFKTFIKTEMHKHLKSYGLATEVSKPLINFHITDSKKLISH